MIVDQVVAYRHNFGKRYRGRDFEIVCTSCRVEDDKPIVLRSENGQRIKQGLLSCGVCKKTIKV